jgi:hypothetical protein
MFNALELKKLMDAKPFRPFRIRMSDGQTHEVPHPDVALVTRNYVEVGTDLDKNKIPGTVTRCAILHITQIEDLQAA